MNAEWLRAGARRLARNKYAYRAYAETLYARYAIREGLWRELIAGRTARRGGARQTVLSWRVPQLSAAAEHPPEALGRWLASQGLRVAEGQHCVYLPPQARLDQFVPECRVFYPHRVGFKILKDQRAPHAAQYVGGPSTPTLKRHLIGSPRDQLATANYLHDAGLAPRLWDLTCWQTGEISRTVFVVDHVEGVRPSRAQCEQFLNTLEGTCRKGALQVLLPCWRAHRDFACPDCENNLIASTAGEVLYVDFQNFCLREHQSWLKHILSDSATHFSFGDSRPWSAADYVYQSIPGVRWPGKRDTRRRWSPIARALERCGIRPEARLVLDIGCNAGLMSLQALSWGAGWVVGWDRPSVAQQAKRLMWALGATRFDVVGAELHEGSHLEVPPRLRASVAESVVLYLSVARHLGYLRSLADQPWRALVYEGHQGERLGAVAESLRRWLGSAVQLIPVSEIPDGDSRARPVMLALRG